MFCSMFSMSVAIFFASFGVVCVSRVSVSVILFLSNCSIVSLFVLTLIGF